MDFNCNIKNILPGRITIVESKDSDSVLFVYDVESNNCNEKIDGNWICNLSPRTVWDGRYQKKKENLENIIDQMGLASGRAQELLSPITSFKKLLSSSQQKLYIIREEEPPYCVIGILKIGQKRLFICDDSGSHHEVDAFCILDFYVHESKQRCGFGHELFDIMLKVEKVDPSKIAIDRPSYKFLEFLIKHYGLKNSKPQANNFVVFSDFFYNRTSLCEPRQNSYCDYSNSTKAITEFDTVSTSKSNKNKAFHSTTGNCQHHKETIAGIDSYFRKKRPPSMNMSDETPPKFSNKDERKWGVYDVLHSYSSNNNCLDDSTKTHSSQCATSSENNEKSCSKKKWDQLLSSWNVLGVKPLDYSANQEN